MSRVLDVLQKPIILRFAKLRSKQEKCQQQKIGLAIFVQKCLRDAKNATLVNFFVESGHGDTVVKNQKNMWMSFMNSPLK